MKSRMIHFVVPADVCVAVDASEMSVDFLATVDWLANDLISLEMKIRREILDAVRHSIDAGRSYVRVTVFQHDGLVDIRVSQSGGNVKHIVVLETQMLSMKDFMRHPETTLAT